MRACCLRLPMRERSLQNAADPALQKKGCSGRLLASWLNSLAGGFVYVRELGVM